MHDVEFFVGLESRVWEALATGDANADRALLSSDFVGVYATGFADRTAHADQLTGGPTMAESTIRDAQLIEVSDTTAMLCYRADFRRAGSELTETMYISSLWCERDGRWWNTFSQDTPAS